MLPNPPLTIEHIPEPEPVPVPASPAPEQPVESEPELELYEPPPIIEPEPIARRAPLADDDPGVLVLRRPQVVPPQWPPRLRPGR
jgi:hypothetical protein